MTSPASSIVSMIGAGPSWTMRPSCAGDVICFQCGHDSQVVGFSRWNIAQVDGPVCQFSILARVAFSLYSAWPSDIDRYAGSIGSLYLAMANPARHSLSPTPAPRSATCAPSCGQANTMRSKCTGSLVAPRLFPSTDAGAPGMPGALVLVRETLLLAA